MKTSEESGADVPQLQQPQDNNLQMEIDGVNSLLEKEKRNHAILLDQLKMHDQSTQVTIQNLHQKLDELKEGRDLFRNKLVEMELSYKIDTEELKDRLNNPADAIECSICLSPWESTGPHRVASLPCGHLYGMSCIRQSVRRTEFCPKCRIPVRFADIRFLLPSTT